MARSLKGPGFVAVLLAAIVGLGSLTPGCARGILEWRLHDGSLLVTQAALYDFGTVPVNVVTTKGFTFSNTGGAAFTGMSTLVSPSGPFSFTGGAFPGQGGTCGETLAPGIDCTITIDITPMTSGTFSSALAISYNDGSEKTSLRAFTGKATGTVPVYRYAAPSGDRIHSTSTDTPPGFALEGNTFFVYEASGVCTTKLSRCTGSGRHFLSAAGCTTYDVPETLGFACPHPKNPDGTVPLIQGYYDLAPPTIYTALADPVQVVLTFGAGSPWHTESFLGFVPAR